ncbi:MAG: AtpZ/AtpI family protein [Dehalococcoidia bacterium]
MPQEPKPPDSQQPGEPGSTGGTEPPGTGSRDSLSATAVLLAKVSGVGWYVASSVAIGTLGGYWLDGQLDTRPVLTLVGIVLGVLAAFIGMVRMLRLIGRSRR